MGLLRFIARFFWVLLLLLGIRVIVGWFSRFRREAGKPQPASSDAAGHPGLVQGQVVRDPWCGTFVDRRIALPWQESQSTHFFCSAECRRKYQTEGPPP